MTDREARRRLHHRLIDLEDRPCLWCGAKGDRDIDRIIEGFKGYLQGLKVKQTETTPN